MERLIIEVIQSLPEEYQFVLRAHYLGNKTAAEIAEVLGLPVGTVRSRLARGRSQLIEALGNPGGTTGRQNPTEDPGLPGSVPRTEGGTR